MKIRALLLMILAVTVSNVLAQALPDEKKLATIRDSYKKVNDRIAEMEKAPEYSSVFVAELLVNKHDASYPAVGIFRSTVTFYYSFGDREKNPYPYRLLKVSVATRRSDKREASEYLFAESGELIFAYAKNVDGEWRAYFHTGRLIRMLKGDSIISNSAAEARRISTEALSEAKKLRNIFINAV